MFRNKNLLLGEIDRIQRPDIIFGWVDKKVLDGRNKYFGINRASKYLQDKNFDVIIEKDGCLKLVEATFDILNSDADQGGRFYFQLSLGNCISYSDFAYGIVRIRLKFKNGLQGIVAPSSDFAQTARAGAAIEFMENMRRLGKFAYKQKTNEIYKTTDFDWTERSYFFQRGTLFSADDLYHNVVTNPPIDPDLALSPLFLPTGIVSEDGSAILGRGGHIFLIGGSNNLPEEYEANLSAPYIVDRANAWLNIFKKRDQILTKRGIQYVQTIFPEKQTVLSHLFPNPISTPGATLDRIESLLMENSQLAFRYFSARHTLSQDSKSSDTFLRMDSHFTPYGTWLVFRDILQHCGYTLDQAPRFDRVKATFGDLAARFFAISFLDQRAETYLGDLEEGFKTAAKKTFEYRPEGHVGFAQSWENPAAPIDKTLLVIGNSFSGPADGEQNSMSWWYAKWFKRYHIIWRPDMTEKMLDITKPDIVICQTIERFLRQVPQS